MSVSSCCYAEVIRVDSILPAILLILFLLPVIWLHVWVYQDAENRGKSGCLVLLLVLLVCGLLGRPARVDPPADRRWGPHRSTSSHTGPTHIGQPWDGKGVKTRGVGAGRLAGTASGDGPVV